MHCLCLPCSDTRRKSRVLKDNDWRELLKWANSVGPGEAAFHRLRVESVGQGRVIWLRDPVENRSSNSLSQRQQSKRIFRPPAQPAAWICEAFIQFLRRSRSSALTKKKMSHQHKQAETNLIIHFAWKRWLRDRLPSANPLERRCTCTPANFAESWYLD